MAEEEIEVFECPERLALFPDLSEEEQTLVVIGGMCYIGVMTVVFLKLYSKLDTTSPKWWSTLKQAWPLLGVFPFLISGVQLHFIESNAFLCITPPNGTWGWWYMPVSTEFQLAATGIAEVIGGFLLTITGLFMKSLVTLRKASALMLFVLTIGMTFANLYMLTHGVWAYDLEGTPLPLVFHAVRFTIQGIWLSNLYYMATVDSLVGSSDDEHAKGD